MDANLLLFKTVIAGDSWGQLAVPVIRAYPYTALLFVGAYLTIVFGVLNLIVAVVATWLQQRVFSWTGPMRWCRRPVNCGPVARW